MASANRCSYCGRFKRWDDMQVTDFTPLNEFGPEEITFTCNECWAKEEVSA